MCGWQKTSERVCVALSGSVCACKCVYFRRVCVSISFHSTHPSLIHNLTCVVICGGRMGAVAPHPNRSAQNTHRWTIQPLSTHLSTAGMKVVRIYIHAVMKTWVYSRMHLDNVDSLLFQRRRQVYPKCLHLNIPAQNILKNHTSNSMLTPQRNTLTQHSNTPAGTNTPASASENPQSMVKILKRQLATQFTLLNNCTPDFLRILINESCDLYEILKRPSATQFAIRNHCSAES